MASLVLKASGMAGRGCVQAGAGGEQPKKKAVLFVCLGNVCRSPTAEAVFKKEVERQGLEGKYKVDSCGLGGGSKTWWWKEGGKSYHEGEEADERMQAAARGKGMKLESISRPMRRGDWEEYDVIVAMDEANVQSLRWVAEKWHEEDGCVPEGSLGKVVRLPEFFNEHERPEVPDPYYEDRPDAFNFVIDLLQDGCRNLLSALESNRI